MEKKKVLETLIELKNSAQLIEKPDQFPRIVLEAKSIATGMFTNNQSFISEIDIVSTKFNSNFFPGDDFYIVDSTLLDNLKKQLTDIIEVMFSHIETYFPDDELSLQKEINPPIVSNDVFIVHGHDEEMIHAVARAVSTIGYNPVILREQPNNGRTIIEKFEDHADVAFAIILLAPDDELLMKDKTTDEYSIEITRTRQNVILEMGFFIGSLGRKRVVALYRESDGFEFPSDYNGVLYIPYNKSGSWKFQLGKEMKAAGLEVDSNKLT